MRRIIAALLAAGGFFAASLWAKPMVWAAEVFMLSSLAVQDNGTLATKNACSDQAENPELRR